ncbi:hypothetical protein BRADI_1g20815v3 [Brachypodium distachyon]|uniref:Uncharacterized protein n=1 Tax=Brachypodium distachyon TaxID=15368 RepID=A0A2K2DKA7_BRADI|nr:hypothetical protein BRADI_1g20815v3 [Brachypodium distachyon]
MHSNLIKVETVGRSEYKGLDCKGPAKSALPLMMGSAQEEQQDANMNLNVLPLSENLASNGECECQSSSNRDYLGGYYNEAGVGRP